MHSFRKTKGKEPLQSKEGEAFLLREKPQGGRKLGQYKVRQKTGGRGDHWELSAD